MPGSNNDRRRRDLVTPRRRRALEENMYGNWTGDFACMVALMALHTFFLGKPRKCSLREPMGWPVRIKCMPSKLEAEIMEVDEW